MGGNVNFTQMIAAQSPSTVAPAPRRAIARCPFHDGPATLDLLLAELDPANAALFDAALDLRSLVAAHAEPNACVEQLFRVRELLDEKHHLAFYRVRCWAQRALQVEVRAARGTPWQVQPLPLDGARVDEIVNGALATLAADGEIPASAHVRFTFTPVA